VAGPRGEAGVVEGLLVAEFEVADVEVFGQFDGAVDHLNGDVIVICHDSAIVQVREADEISPEEHATHERQGEQAARLVSLGGFNPVGLMTHTI
jgi:hypothetical protein